MDYFSQYVTDEDFEHYINRKRFDNCYGNNVEMQAIAEIYNRSIEVFQYTTGKYLMCVSVLKDREELLLLVKYVYVLAFKAF